MPYAVSTDEQTRRLVIDYEGAVDSAQLVASRAEAAERNADGRLRDFILDFSRVRTFALAPEAVAGIREIDRARRAALPEGRCAVVSTRELVADAVTALTALSVLPLDFRLFDGRGDAEAWLGGTLGYDPPRPPRRR